MRTTRKMMIFGAGALVGAIGVVAVLSRLAARSRSSCWECDEDCDDCELDAFERTQRPVEMAPAEKAAVTKALADMYGKIQQTAADIAHIVHCAPTNTDKSVDWDDPCYKCTNKGSEHCDKGVKTCPFTGDVKADKAEAEIDGADEAAEAKS